MTDRALRLLLQIRRRLVVSMADFRLRSERKSLASDKAGQRMQFDELAKSLPRSYAAIRERFKPEFMVPDWSDHLSALEREFSPAPPFGFLRHPRVLFTMFILPGRQLMQSELALLEDRFDPDSLPRLLEEDYVGDPILMNKRYRTSSQAIHHLYHLARFTRSAKVELSSLDTVVEWGAGYGNLAKLYRRVHGSTPTQVLVDLPIFSAIQYLYLGTVFGADQVRLLTEPGQAIEPGKITMVPVGLADAVTTPADLFISTWAISESSAAAQRYVAERDWFGARRLLLAYQRSNSSFPDAERVGELAVADGATREPVEVLRGNAYAFR
jgi:hypothetical protein